MDKNIPLSELIKIGCRKTAPTKNRYIVKEFWDGKSKNFTTMTCALGAASIALRGEVYPPASDLLDPLLEWTKNVILNHPITGCKESLFTIITNLNDNYGWSRETIAFWLHKQGY